MAESPIARHIKNPNPNEVVESLGHHQQGERVVGHQFGAISTPDRLMQFNTQDLAAEKRKVVSSKSLVQFGSGD
jgi:hypothetical protein